MVTVPAKPSSDLCEAVRADTYDELSRKALLRGVSATVLLAVALILGMFTTVLPREDVYLLGGSFGMLAITRMLDAIQYGRKASRLQMRLLSKKYRHGG